MVTVLLLLLIGCQGNKEGANEISQVQIPSEFQETEGEISETVEENNLSMHTPANEFETRLNVELASTAIKLSWHSIPAASDYLLCYTEENSADICNSVDRDRSTFKLESCSEGKIYSFSLQYTQTETGNLYSAAKPVSAKCPVVSRTQNSDAAP